MAVYALAFNV